MTSAAPVVAIPDRNTLLVADPAVPDAFENLVAAISEADDPKPIARRVVRPCDRSGRAAGTHDPAGPARGLRDYWMMKQSIVVTMRKFDSVR